MKAKKKTPTPKPRHTMIIITIGLLMTLMGAYSVQQYFAFEATAAHADGVVRDLERHMHRTGRRGGTVATVRPLIEFTPEGYQHPIKVHTATEERDSYDVGDQVPVAYQPNSPERTLRIETGLPGLDTAVGVIGLVLVLRAVLSRYRWMRDPVAPA